MVATVRKNNAFNTMTDGDERTAFDIDPDAVDRAQEIVASLADEYLQWLSADIDEIENSLPEAYKNPQRVDQLRRKAHDVRGQGGSFGFPLIPHLADGLHLVMVPQDGPRRRGSDAWIVCRDADCCRKAGVGRWGRDVTPSRR